MVTLEGWSLCGVSVELLQRTILHIHSVQESKIKLRCEQLRVAPCSDDTSFANEIYWHVDFQDFLIHSVCMLAKQNYHTTHIVVNNIVGATSVNKTDKQHIETIRHTSEDVVRKKKVSLTLN